MSTEQSPALPGRLGRPDIELRDDPRLDPRLLAPLAGIELDGSPPPLPVDGDSPIEAILEFANVAEEGFNALGQIFTAATPAPEGVESYTEVIRGVDGNDINLYVHRPANVDGPLPCIVHTHGGGMVILEASNAGYTRWRDELAAAGLIAIGVEFRNGAGALGPHPFPAGLNDCASAAQWTIDKAKSLDASKVIMSGESGGGNLALATALKANQEGWIGGIAGVYGQCPYISGVYSKPPNELTSLVENDNYFLNVERQMGALAKAYDPEGRNSTNPLAWPYHATTEDLRGLPPHVISVNELDPLRDEGLAYFRKLLAAGVDAVSRTVNGTVHAGDCIFLDAIPDVYRATIGDIKRFADAV